MLKGFSFFLKQGWKYDKKYIIWLFLLQIVTAITPIASALLPKMVIDELTGQQRFQYLILYVLVFAGWICIRQRNPHEWYDAMAAESGEAGGCESQREYCTTE